MNTEWINDGWEGVGRMDDTELRKNIIEELSKQPTMVLVTAMMYARCMVVYGVSVVEQWKTAVQQSNALSQAERYGYAKATENLKKQCEFCKYKNIILRQREKDGETKHGIPLSQMPQRYGER